jgi:hypothetical protein
LLWFRVEFADGSSRWLRIPDHPTCANHIERRRLGSLATTVGQAMPMGPPRNEQEAKWQERRINERLEAGREHVPPIPPGEGPLPMQYRPPMPAAQLLLSSYARYVCRTTEHPEGSPVTGVKIYRLEYRNPPAQHFQAGREPLDPTLYAAWYQGDFAPDGQVKPSCLRIVLDKAGRPMVEHQDPFLYWLLPIVRVPENEDKPALAAASEIPTPQKRELTPWSGEGKVINYVFIHAGDKEKEDLP